MFCDLSNSSPFGLGGWFLRPFLDAAKKFVDCGSFFQTLEWMKRSVKRWASLRENKEGRNDRLPSLDSHRGGPCSGGLGGKLGPAGPGDLSSFTELPAERVAEALHDLAEFARARLVRFYDHRAKSSSRAFGMVHSSSNTTREFAPLLRKVAGT